jgi:hypothetical protein
MVLVHFSLIFQKYWIIFCSVVSIISMVHVIQRFE